MSNRKATGPDVSLRFGVSGMAGTIDADRMRPERPGRPCEQKERGPSPQATKAYGPQGPSCRSQGLMRLGL